MKDLHHGGCGACICMIVYTPLTSAIVLVAHMDLEVKHVTKTTYCTCTAVEPLLKDSLN